MFAVSRPLAEAVRDYRLLLDKGYPTTASIKLVGDRYRLDRDERLILFRGVASSEDSARRRSLLRASAAGRFLLVDGYNQIFSILHYRNGRPVFLSIDGFLRDVGASHGRIPDKDRFSGSMDFLADALAAAAPARVAAYFDAPVSGSAEHACRFADCLRSRGLTAEAFVEKSADVPLKAAPESSVVATSDSAVLDALARGRGDEAAPNGAAGPAAYDAARAAIERAFGVPAWSDLAAVTD